MENQAPRALIIYESMFGNTAAVAAAIADGLRELQYDVSICNVTCAPCAPLDTDLLVIGAPTHAFSLSRPNTRREAVRQGAEPAREGVGLREWLATQRLTTDAVAPPVAVFDSRVSKVRRLPRAAGRTAARLARRHGFPLVTDPEAFLVEDVKGPLVAGELEHAAAWGRKLGGITPLATKGVRDQVPGSSGISTLPTTGADQQT